MNPIVKANKAIEKAVVTGYKAIESGVVSGYQAIENGVVGGYKKVESAFVEAFLSPDEPVGKESAAAASSPGSAKGMEE